MGAVCGLRTFGRSNYYLCKGLTTALIYTILTLYKSWEYAHANTYTRTYVYTCMVISTSIQMNHLFFTAALTCMISILHRFLRVCAQEHVHIFLCNGHMYLSNRLHTDDQRPFLCATWLCYLDTSQFFWEYAYTNTCTRAYICMYIDIFTYYPPT